MPKRRSSSRSSIEPSPKRTQGETSDKSTRKSGRFPSVGDNREPSTFVSWGPFLADRQWGTVREDYSKDGDYWASFTYDDARGRAYRWGEDGIMGICDDKSRLCLSLGLWNGKDPHIKERFFGLGGKQGNHGEDVKECYYYLDSNPQHSYMKALYKYPQELFPYENLVEENASRGLNDPEYELIDTGVFENDKYWDVFMEYAKTTDGSIQCRVTVHNRGNKEAEVHVIPQIWFRNTWSWGEGHPGRTTEVPSIQLKDGDFLCDHEDMGSFTLMSEKSYSGNEGDFMLTNNITNSGENEGPFKDGFHKYIVDGDKSAALTKDGATGTKAAVCHKLLVPPGGESTVRFIISAGDTTGNHGNVFGRQFEKGFETESQKTDAFYQKVLPPTLSSEQRKVSRQAYAGLLWTKMFYHFDVRKWINGDDVAVELPESRKTGTNHEWKHLYNCDVISMPDKWEFPWYAVWDLAFHMIPFSDIDREFTKKQLLLFLNEGYMHPNGQLPAYENNFSDVNPPVHAWACLNVYRDGQKEGSTDVVFLKRCFNKLLLNFAWWVNKKDPTGKHLFSGGFLGMDNVAAFDRSDPPFHEGNLFQADGTGWMAFFALTLFEMSVELSHHDVAYIDQAVKFYEHYLCIVKAINGTEDHQGLWCPDHKFYYDCFQIEDEFKRLHTRSLSGIVPLFATLTFDMSKVGDLPELTKRLDALLERRVDLKEKVSQRDSVQFLSIPRKDKLESILSYLLDEDEFLSPYGIRSLSKVHKENPYSIIFNVQVHSGGPIFHMDMGEKEYSVSYAPGESNTDMFGGNSNWRGPVWICMNYLIIESLEKFDSFYGDDLKVAFPTRSKQKLRLRDVAKELCRRISKIFLPNAKGARPCHGNNDKYAADPYWRDLVLFNEYFHGDSGQGLGASHQTGWTALITKILEKAGPV
ncbi:unnamed protein product [Owenia fusiformis]|uniref:Mannosylglycerate hydrolase MGH1-like glycoside hydrolase domain-containing protein n=1 Tax=Owenia fusiformis TaxID=6347 RepID=A0A8J1UVH2_OWEFU|nr:unnamed protein product [Owenia fusiformis]